MRHASAVIVIEYVLLPVLAVACAGTAIAVRGGSRQRYRIVLGLTVLLVDLWLWLAVTEPPLGPHYRLLVVLLILHFVIALVAIRDLTGFSVASTRYGGRSAGRYRRVSGANRRTYSAYRGD
jgi:hypothetical protein